MAKRPATLPELRSFPFSAMGSDCVLHFYAAGAAAEEAADAAMTEAFRIEETYSRYRHDNVLARINQVALSGGTVEVDAETGGLLDYAYACHRESGGLFDITSGVLRKAWDFASGRLPVQAEIDRILPRVGLDKTSWDFPRMSFAMPGMELDFGGICKEYAADRVADICRDRNISSGLVDLGGDIRVIGPRPHGEPWTISIRHPRSPAAAMATVRLAQGAIASSGDYERSIAAGGRRYCHILNPKTGWPVQGLASVSVMAAQCLLAGSISTIAMLKGSEGAAWLQGLGISHLWMNEDGISGGNIRTAE